MAETTTLCVSVQAGEHLLSGPDWLKIEDNRTLVDVLVEVSGRQALGYQVQVIVSKEPSFTEAALMKILNCVSTLRTSGNIYVKFLLKSSVLPSQQRYEETKCKAERDTDVPLIESLQSPIKEDRDGLCQRNAMSFDEPFESNYLNKLLSEQNLSPTTLSSLKKELIKKRHLKDHDHYTTWQEQITTSPVKDFQSISIASVKPQYPGLTNWAGGNKVEDSIAYEEIENGDCKDDGIQTVCDPYSEDKQPYSQKPNKNSNDDSEMNQDGEHQKASKIVKISLVNQSIEKEPTRASSKIKDETKKAPMRKIMVPKTNRSTALRVKKNSVSCGEMQKKDKGESQKSGMPILSQKMTRSTKSKPKKTVKSNCVLSTMGKEQDKESNTSAKNTISSKASIDRKGNSQNLCIRAKISNDKSNCLESRTSANQSKQEESEKGLQNMKASHSLLYRNKIKQITKFKPMKSKTEKNNQSVNEHMEMHNPVNQKKECNSMTGEDDAFVQRGEVLNELCTSTDETLKEDCRQKETCDINSMKSCTDSNSTKYSVVEFREAAIMKECSSVISEADVTAAPNELAMTSSFHRPVFQVDGLDENFIEESNGIDSFDDITIYESMSDKKVKSPTNEKKNPDTDMQVTTARTALEKSGNETESNIAKIEQNRRSEFPEADFFDCDTASPDIDDVDGLLSSGRKDCLLVANGAEPDKKSMKSSQDYLPERPKFFKTFPNQASFGKLLKGSFDSSDFVDSSELQRKCSTDKSKCLKRSESLDRNSSGVVPKKTGFFHDLKEKAKDADNSLFFSANDHNDIKLHLPLSIVDEMTDKPSLSIALPHNITDNSSVNKVHPEKRSPSQSHRSCLSITNGKIDLSDLSIAECRNEKVPNGKSPTLLGEIGRESALSRTFSLDNENDNASPQAKSERQDATTPNKVEKPDIAHAFNGQGKSLGEEVLKPERSQHTYDDGPTNCNIDFGKDIECHTRKKWNLEIDIINQLLLSSLEDQCKSLSSTAERILSKLRSAEYQREASHRYFEEIKGNSWVAVNSQVGITGKLFKTLQSLEKQLAEIEENLEKSLHHKKDIADSAKNDNE